MSNPYLDILELSPGATPQEVKAAYRRLSKKYHPDLNSDPNAHDQFVALTEAYNFLSKVGPTPAQEQVSYDYDPLVDEYEVWRRRARERAKRKAREEALLQLLLIKRLIRGMNYILGAICLFNLLLAIDYFLPLQPIPQEIQTITQELHRRGSGTYTYTEVQFTDFNIRFESEAYKAFKGYERIYVFATQLFQKPLKVEIHKESRTLVRIPYYNVYLFFGYLIPALVVLAGTYFFVFRAVEPKFTMGLLVTIVAIIQLVFFLRS